MPSLNTARPFPVWVAGAALSLRLFAADPATPAPSSPTPTPAAPDDRTAIALEAISRLKGMDLEANPALKAALLKVLDQLRGKPQFIEIVRDFAITDRNPEVLELAVRYATDSTGADAARLLLQPAGLDLLRTGLAGTNAVRLAEALGNTSDRQIVPLLLPVVTDPAREPAVRKQAARSLARVQEGATALLALAKEGRLPDDVQFTAATELNAARWPAVKEEAARLLPLPQGRDALPLPPVQELAKRSGNAARGAEVFRRDTVGCIKCHQVGTEGIDVGPALTEIGGKLGKDALYESILDPSAGISFGFEAWQIELKDGSELFGLIVSETPDELAVKAQTGIVTRIAKQNVARRDRQKLSIMPAGLQAAVSTDELVDLVEYLTTLRKAP